MNDQEQIDALKAQVNCLREVLEQLAKLGNGDKYGNSIGNTIAINALAKTPEQCLAEVKAKAIERCKQEHAKRIKYLEMVVSMCHTMDEPGDKETLEQYTAPIALMYSLESDFNAPEEINLWYGVEDDYR